MVHFRGIIGYLVTPFGPSGAPDLSVLSGLVEHLIEQGFTPLPPRKHRRKRIPESG